MKELCSKILTEPDFLLTVIALVTSIISIIIGSVALYIQRKHNQKSVLPIGNISLTDYEDCLSIKIFNNGAGPMIINSCNTESEKESKPYPIDWMPEGITWRKIRKNLENQAILPGGYQTLIELWTNLANDSEKEQRDRTRNILKDLELVVEYSDVYGKKFKVNRKFDWVGRNL